MNNEIRKAVVLNKELEDRLFDLADKAWAEFEKGDFAQSQKYINQAWELVPEPKYNTSCSGMVLRAMHEIHTQSGDYDKLETLFSEWTQDMETSGYKVFDVEPFILLAETYLFKNQIDKSKEQFAKAKKYKATKRAFSEKPAFYFEIMQGKITDNAEIARLFKEAMLSENLREDVVEISAEISEKIDEWAEKGNDFFDEEKYQEAILTWLKGLALIPEPQQFYAQSQWFEVSIGDGFFQLGEFATALVHFENAKGNVMGNGYENAFICLRLGQCYLETGDKTNAKEFLLRAYMLEGEEIFEEEDEKYFQFLRKNVNLSEK